MLQTLSTLFYRLPLRVQEPFNKWWYETMSALDNDADMIFMNYGWAHLDTLGKQLPLKPEDESNRYCIQLYHRVANAINLHGLDVLEVGSGRGGGASYVARYLKPKSMTGIDLAANAIKFCQKHYKVPGLSFMQGNAEQLALPAESLDAVINVESSHCYISMSKFLDGVYGMLKHGGHLLFTDLRDKDQIDLLRQQLIAPGFTIVEEEVINANIIRALEMDNARKQALIQLKVPRILRHFFNEFAAMEGTHSIHATLRKEEKLYVRFCLQKA